ncbi:MAG: hypothetical protein WCJ57_02250 [Candidatus Falkowbacteria bacterium]
MSIIRKFQEISGQERFKGWPLVGGYELGAKIPFFGQELKYTLRTGNGDEEYYSLIRSFGWVVVFGVTDNQKVLTLVQWKPGVNCASWELPPGGIGKLAPGASQAEITEKSQDIYLKETGYGEGKWEYLGNSVIETGKYRGAGPDDHGLLAHMYLATDLKKISDARQPNRNEIMETLEVPLDEFRAVLESGLFREVSAVNCAMLALLKLGAISWK